MMDCAADSVEAADALRAQFVAAIPLNRMGRPEEIAAAALFWPPMTAVSWPGPNSASMAAWHRSNYRTGPLQLGSACGAEALDEISSGGILPLDAPRSGAGEWANAGGRTRRQSGAAL
jgi:hypothetical protein